MNADLSQRQRNLRRLLRPRHVAIVGGQAMADSIRRCADTGFTGEVWVVNPKYPELGGRKCYASLADLPEAPDATFIAGICLWPTGALGQQVETGCAIVMQSGNIALNLSRNDRSVPFAYVISSGNQAILNAADYVDALADDPKVTAIGLYLEGIKDVPAFSRAAAKALLRGKPLVAAQIGRAHV